jgi:hypothetical protein
MRAIDTLAMIVMMRGHALDRYESGEGFAVTFGRLVVSCVAQRYGSSYTLSDHCVELWLVGSENAITSLDVAQARDLLEFAGMSRMWAIDGDAPRYRF